MSNKQTWIVEGEHTIHCAGCAQTIDFTLSRLPGVDKVNANHKTQRVEVETTTPDVQERIEAELRNLGYQIREISDHETTHTTDQ